MIEEGIHINGIYEHYKEKHLYKVKGIAYHAGLSAPVVIYEGCTPNGIFRAIRKYSEDGNTVTYVKQPFYRDLEDFVSNVVGGYPNNPAIPRFKYIKTL